MDFHEIFYFIFCVHKICDWNVQKICIHIWSWWYLKLRKQTKGHVYMIRVADRYRIVVCNQNHVHSTHVSRCNNWCIEKEKNKIMLNLMMKTGTQKFRMWTYKMHFDICGCIQCQKMGKYTPSIIESSTEMFAVNCMCGWWKRHWWQVTSHIAMGIEKLTFNLHLFHFTWMQQPLQSNTKQIDHKLYRAHLANDAVDDDGDEVEICQSWHVICWCVNICGSDTRMCTIRPKENEQRTNGINIIISTIAAGVRCGMHDQPTKWKRKIQNRTYVLSVIAPIIVSTFGRHFK